MNKEGPSAYDNAPTGEFLARVQDSQVAEPASGLMSAALSPLNPVMCPEPGNEAQPARKRRILLADDDAAVRESLGRVLESEDYEVSLARTGREAVSQFMSAPPDLVLLDLNMPDKDGWEAFDLMERLHPLLPVIVITARPNQYERARGAGIDALMEKPLDLALLLETMKELLAQSEQDRVAALTDRDFGTAYLKHSPEAPPPNGEATSMNPFTSTFRPGSTGL